MRSGVHTKQAAPATKPQPSRNLPRTAAEARAQAAVMIADNLVDTQNEYAFHGHSSEISTLRLTMPGWLYSAQMAVAGLYQRRIYSLLMLSHQRQQKQTRCGRSPPARILTAELTRAPRTKLI